MRLSTPLVPRSPKPTLGAVLEVGCRTRGGHLTRKVPEVTYSRRSPFSEPHVLVPSCQPCARNCTLEQPGDIPARAPRPLVTSDSPSDSTFTPVITMCKPAHGAPLLPPEGAQRDFLGTQDPPEHPEAYNHPPAHPTCQRAAGLLSISLSLHCLGGTNGQGAAENQQSHCTRVDHPQDCRGCAHQCPGVSSHAQGQYIGVKLLTTPQISPSSFPSLPQPP